VNEETGRAIMALQKRYKIKRNEVDFRAGRAEDNQVLLGLVGFNSIVVFFDLDGSLIRWEQRPLPESTPEYYERDHEAAIRRELDRWSIEMGLSPQTINVCHFEVPELGIGIMDPPLHIQQSRQEIRLGSKSPAELAVLSDELARWEDSGLFVLRWGRDFWLTADGEVHST
jgi:hypothetical protein